MRSRRWRSITRRASSYFRGELEQFLLLAKENKLDPLTTTGSYAGAMGAPQFMPSAYRRYAVGADTDKPRDLWGDWDDILASVANYLHEYGWTPVRRCWRRPASTRTRPSRSSRTTWSSTRPSTA